MRVRWAFAGVVVGIVIAVIAQLGDEERIFDLLYQLIHHPGFVVFLVAFLYLGIVVAVRWLLLANPLKAMLRATLAATRARSSLITDEAKSREATKQLLDGADNILSRRPGALDVLFWGACEIEVDQRLLAANSLLQLDVPDNEVNVRLLTTAIELESRSATGELAAEIRKVLATNSTATMEYKRALLVVTSDLGLTRVGVANLNITTWHRKSFLIILTGLVLIVVTGSVFERWQLLLVGALAAFLSRLWRALRAREVPKEYWSQWTTLMLAPVAGALAAVGGLLVFELLKATGVVGEALSAVGWNTPTAPETLAVAFLLGFSERYLDRLTAEGEKAATPTAGPSAAPAPVHVAPERAVNGAGATKEPLKVEPLASVVARKSKKRR